MPHEYLIEGVIEKQGTYYVYVLLNEKPLKSMPLQIKVHESNQEEERRKIQEEERRVILEFYSLFVILKN